MDPVTAAVLTILGKYALDKGSDLAKEVGPHAAATAKKLFQVALDRVRQRGKETIAEEFEKDPETYEKPVAKEVAAAKAEDNVFADQVEELLKQYEDQAAAHAIKSGQTYQSVVKGKGNTVVQGDGNVTATGGSAAAGGNMGNVTLGGKADE